MPSKPAFTPCDSSSPASTGGAVFTGDAREDAVVNRAIAEPLKALQIEAWLDQNEFRGGDARDQEFKKQIRECPLFVPVISANTPSRPEGDFRMEWNPARDRSPLSAPANHRRHKVIDVAHAMPGQVAGKDTTECLDRYRGVVK